MNFVHYVSLDINISTSPCKTQYTKNHPDIIFQKNISTIIKCSITKLIHSALSCDQSRFIQWDGISLSYSFKYFYSKDLNHFDLGVNFGAGLNIRGLLICAQQRVVLLNLSPESLEYNEMKNIVLGISLTSSFTGK